MVVDHEGSPEGSSLTVGFLSTPALALVQGQVLDAVVCGAGKVKVCELLERHPAANGGDEDGDDQQLQAGRGHSAGSDIHDY